MTQVLANQTNREVGGFANARLLDAGIVVGASILMALCAHVSIPLWFTPVPITLQTFGVALLALTLGARRSFAALVLYLLEGVSGLPVFSPHGPGGIAQLLGPTGGYLMAYPFAAWICATIVEKLSQRSKLRAFGLGAIASDVVILTSGALWLFAVTHKSPSTIFLAAVLPFLPGEVLKTSAAVALAFAKNSIRTRS